MAAVEEKASKQNPWSNADGVSVTNFEKLWRNAVDDNYLTLFGFRRYRTSHLLNLRFLEAEIDKTDHTLFQAGLSLDYVPVLDRLGLGTAKKDAPPAAKPVDRALVLQLRDLLKQYGKSVTNTAITYTLDDSRLQTKL